MNHRDDDNCYEDKLKYGEPASGHRKVSGKIVTATKVIRAATAIICFAVPVVTGTAVLFGYGVHRLYERIAGRS